MTSQSGMKTEQLCGGRGAGRGEGLLTDEDCVCVCGGGAE